MDAPVYQDYILSKSFEANNRRLSPETNKIE